MADNVENLILEHLRAIRADIGGIKDDVREIKHRLTSSEAAVASIQRDYAMFDFQAMRASACKCATISAGSSRCV